MSEINMNTNNIDLIPYIKVKDPISALTHFIGFLSSIIMTPILLSKAGVRDSDLITMIACSIYCLSMIVLYGASTSYHTFILPEKGSRILKKIDHISIFYLIAGTYTPICLLSIREQGGIPLLIGVWATAFAGTILKLCWVYCPKYVSSIVYIAMGWLAIFKIRTIYLALGTGGFFWLLAGGILYTIGGVLYAFRFRISDRWSEHEIFHIFVLLGSLCHFILIFNYVI